jgi:hypothetical protein
MGGYRPVTARRRWSARDPLQSDPYLHSGHLTPTRISQYIGLSRERTVAERAPVL